MCPATETNPLKTARPKSHRRNAETCTYFDRCMVLIVGVGMLMSAQDVLFPLTCTAMFICICTAQGAQPFLTTGHAFAVPETATCITHPFCTRMARWLDMNHALRCKIYRFVKSSFTQEYSIVGIYQGSAPCRALKLLVQRILSMPVQ